jgi:hypothetical protein
MEVPFRVRGGSGTVFSVGVDEVRLRMRSRGPFRWRTVDATYAEVVAVDVTDTGERVCVVVGMPMPVPAGPALRVRVALNWAEDGDKPETWLIGTDQATVARQLVDRRGGRYRAEHPPEPAADQAAAEAAAEATGAAFTRFVVRTVGVVLLIWGGWGLWGTWFTDIDEYPVLSTIVETMMIMLGIALLSGSAQRYVRRVQERVAARAASTRSGEQPSPPTGPDHQAD